MHTSEHQTRLLLEQVPVDLVGAYERDPMLPVGALLLQASERRLDAHALRLEFALGLEPALARLRVMDEIADRERRRAVEREGNQDGAETFLDDHADMLPGDA